MTNPTQVCITRESSLRSALELLDSVGTGILLLVNEQGVFQRTVTDGDVRRLLIAGFSLDDRLVELSHLESIVLQEDFSRLYALELMNTHGINHLPVVDSFGRVVRLVSRQDLDQKILLSSPHLGELERGFVEDAFRTNWIAPLGPNVDAFESELAEYVGLGHAAAVSSGTAAIHLALILLGVETGDIVFCSALTFVASANPILYQGAEPVFIDSEPTSWNMSPVALEDAFREASAIGRIPKAVIVVNLYGQSADFDAIAPICEKYGVPIVEDAAESLGSFYKGRASGSFGSLGTFSFNGNKIITTSGGGMLVSQDHSLIERARFLSTQARESVLHYEHNVVGYNYRMSNILAGVGRGQLHVLEDRVEARRHVFERYRSSLVDVSWIKWMPEPEWSRSNRWLSAFTIDPDSGLSVAGVISCLSSRSIEARPVWKPMQLQPLFADCKYFSHQGSSVSRFLFDFGLCLPSGSNMTDSQQDSVINCLRSISLP